MGSLRRRVSVADVPCVSLQVSGKRVVTVAAAGEHFDIQEQFVVTD
jgi:hypothetical protein